MNKLLKSIVAATVGVAMAIGAGVGLGREAKAAYAAEEVYKTALFGSDYNSKSVQNYTSTWTATNDGFTVSLSNFNNNANGWNYVKCGNKTNASVCDIVTSAAIDKAITKVVITIDAITAANVNSIKLYTSNNNSTWTSAGEYDKATGEQAVVISSPTTNLYYKAEFDCKKGSSNGLVTVSKLDYYYNAGGPTTYSVTYNSNGAKAGNAPTDANQYVANAQVTVLGNTGNLSYYGYLFNGWNTAANGTGTSYAEGQTFSINANTTLFAQWVADPNPAGTQTNPYTVAQARAAIDANDGITGVYATGIVSEIVTHFDSQYGNVTYNITSDGKVSSEYLQAYRGIDNDGVKFTDETASKVVVGATVVVYGNLTKHSSTYEFAQNNWLISSIAPDILLSDDYFELEPNETHTLTADKENVTWSSNNPSVATVSSSGVVTGVSTGKAEITATVGDLSATSNVTVVLHGTDSNPLTVDQARASLDVISPNVSARQLFVTGIVSKHAKFDTTHDNANIYLQNDAGSNDEYFELYHCGIDSSLVDNAADYKDENALAGCTVIARGYAKLYNGKYELSDKESVYPSIIEVVPPAPKALSSILVNDPKTIFEQGDLFSFEGTVTATYDDGTTADVTSSESLSFSGYNMLTSGKQTVTVSYTEGETTKTDTYEITVNAGQPKIIWDLSKKTYTLDGDSTVNWSSEYVSLTNTSDADLGAGGTSASNYLGGDSNNRTSSRMYSGNIMTLSPSSGYAIAYAEFTAASTNYATALADSEWTNATASAEGTKVTIVPSNPAKNIVAVIGGTCGFTSVTVFYNDAPAHLSSATSITGIRGNEVLDENGKVTAVTSLTLRFGVKIPKADWDAVNNITEYGIMMFLTTKAKESSAPTVEQRYLASASNVSVVSRNAETAPDEDGQGNYNFLVVVNVPDTLPTQKGFNYDSYFCVRPYVKIGEQIYWLLAEDIHESIITLAEARNNTNLSKDALDLLASK